MPSSMPSLCVLEIYDSKKPKESTQVRIEYFNTYDEGVAEAIKWAGKKSCRCFEIDEKLARKIYKGVEIVPLSAKKNILQKSKTKKS